MAKRPALIIKDLHKRYGKLKALDGISLDVEQGEIFGFLGPNGAGKTTTIRCILGFINPLAGDIKVMGQSVQKNPVATKKSLAYLSGEDELYPDMRVNQFLNFILQLRGTKTGKYSVKYLPYIKRFNLDSSLKRKIKTLSKGNRQKVSIISALMLDADVLVLDEPTNGLDPLMQEEFYEIILDLKKKGKTVFMSSHILSDVQKVCDRAAIIKRGKIVAIEDIKFLANRGILNIEFEAAEEVSEKDFAKIKEVIEVNQTKSITSVKVKGSPDAAIKKIAQFTIKSIEIRHADLEEIFMEFYNES